MEHMYKINRHRILWGVVCLGFAIGCGGGASSGDDGPPDDPAFPAPPDGEGLQLVSAVRVEPGAEQLACRYVVLPARALEIARFAHHYTAGSHHMLVYPTSLSPAEVDDQVFDCQSVGDLEATGVLYGASEPDGELPYPDGIGMKLPASSVVLLETHYLNPTDTPLDAVARVNLWFAPTPIAVEAGTLFFRDWAIYVPPAPGEATATMRCELPQAVSLLYATSHMHRRGVAFHAQVIPPAGAAHALHDSNDWATPTPTVFWPPLELAAGSQLEFGCSYRNDGTTAVVEGGSAETDEMCVLVGGYWPRMSADAELCLGDGSGPVLAGANTCEQTVDCMVDAGVGNWVGGQQCVADTCAASAPALSSFVVCVNRYDCWGDASCVAAHCATQYASCTQARCD